MDPSFLRHTVYIMLLEEHRLKCYVGGSQKVCSVLQGFELKDGYIKYNKKTEILKSKTDNALPYTNTHTHARTHNVTKNGWELAEIFTKLKAHNYIYNLDSTALT